MNHIKLQKKIEVHQISHNQFQIRDPVSGEVKTFKIDLPKGKTLEDVLRSNPHLISQINELEKEQKLTVSTQRIAESTETAKKLRQNTDQNSAPQSTVSQYSKPKEQPKNQKEKKDSEFER